MVPLYWKHSLIRTPLEGPARRLRHLLNRWQVLRHSGLHDVYAEEREIDRLFDVLVRPHSNCVDVGAHIGSTLSSIIRRAPRGKHIAIEPVPMKAAWLRRKFPEVEVHEIALADATGEQRFLENRNSSGLSRILTAEQSVTSETTVKCDRLDNIIDPGRRVGFVKIDVEGAELLALRGAASLLLRDRPAVLFESTPGGAERFGLTRAGLFAFLTKEMDYSIYLIGDYIRGGRPLDLAGFEECHQYPFRAFNYVAAA